jgi:hypothetical protein
MKTLRTLIAVTAFWTGWASADEMPSAPSAATWRSAAEAALARMAPDPDEILVLAPGLSAEAVSALKSLHKAVTEDQLPDREQYVLPPGPYVWVRRFEPRGDRFEFRSTGGMIIRNNVSGCGYTTHFFLIRDQHGVWKLDGSTDITVC